MMRVKVNSGPEKYLGVILFFGVSLLYYLANIWVTGPAYLADEIGYLNNASFLAGHFVHGASSYFAGYSFLIAPLFILAPNPAAVWQGVLITNALMWGGSFLLLFSFFSKSYAGASPRRLFVLALLLAVYPPNIVMAGYAFSQSCVTFLFSLCLRLILIVRPDRVASILPSSIIGALIFWVHPTGIVVPIALVFCVGLHCLKAGAYRTWFVSLLMSLVVVLFYKDVVEPWRIIHMTAPGNSPDLHYPTLSEELAGLKKIDTWYRVFSLAAGQAAYLIIATFGFACLGFVSALFAVLELRSSSLDRIACGNSIARVFCALVIIGVIALPSITGGVAHPDRLDHWVYGRYSDAFLLPLFGMGWMLGRYRMPALTIAVVTALIGLFLIFVVDINGPVNRVNISGLWPEGVLGDGKPLYWFYLGALGILACLSLPRKITVFIMVPLYIFAALSQRKWHEQILVEHSNPSEFVEFVRSNFPKGDCVGFDYRSLPKGISPFSREAERARLYSFFFFDYKYQIMSEAEWRANCAGPLLTYDESLGRTDPKVSLLGMESQTRLFLFAKKSPTGFILPKRASGALRDTRWASEPLFECAVQERCLALSGAALGKFTQVGAVDSARLASSGVAGYLLYGPYAPLKAGRYKLTVYGSATNTTAAVLDVTASNGSVVVAQTNRFFNNAKHELATLDFELSQDVRDLEVRLRLEAANKVAISSYSIEPAETRRTNVSASSLGSACYLSGWSGIEPWGIWTNGSVAKLAMPASILSGFGGKLTVRLDGRVYVTPRHPRQRIIVRLHGRTLAERVVAWPNQRVVFELALGDDKINDELTFQIATPDAVSPKSLAYSDDDRKLGFGLEQVSIAQ